MVNYVPFLKSETSHENFFFEKRKKVSLYLGSEEYRSLRSLADNTHTGEGCETSRMQLEDLKKKNLGGAGAGY